MQEGRIEIKSRPKMQGWLEKLVNEVFEIWQCKYFVLDGTELLVFEDDTRAQLEASISLERCMVDGIWIQGDLYTITLRSLDPETEEQFTRLGALSLREMTEWKEILQTAIILLEYETLYETLEKEQTQNNKHKNETNNYNLNDEFSISDVDSDELNEHPVYKSGCHALYNGGRGAAHSLTSIELKQLQFQVKEDLLSEQGQWKFIKGQSGMRISKQILPQNNNSYKLKCSLILPKANFDELTNAFSDPLNESLWSLRLEKKELALKVNEDYHVYQAVYKFFRDEQQYQFSSTFREISWFQKEDLSLFFSLKTRLSDQLKSSQALQFDKELPIEQSLIKLQKGKKGAVQLEAVIKANKSLIDKNPIFEKFLIESMLDLGVFQYEYPEILEKIKMREKRLLDLNINPQIREFQPLRTIKTLESKKSEKNMSHPLSQQIPSNNSNKLLKENGNRQQEKEQHQGEIKQKHQPQQLKSTPPIDKNFPEVQSNEMNLIPKNQVQQIPNEKVGVEWDEKIHLRRFHLNSEQLKIVEEFAGNNKEKNITENEYIQFLEARRWNVKFAQEMIDGWYKWLIDNNVLNLTVDSFPHLNELKVQIDQCILYFIPNYNKAYRYLGKDFQGRPIGLGCSRYIFPKQLKDYDEYCLFFGVYLREMRKKQTYCINMFLTYFQRAGGYVDQIIMINDVGGLTNSNFDLSLTKKQLELVLDIFPEGVYRLLVVNADFFTKILAKVVLPFLEKRTKEKLVIVGTDQAEIRKVFAEYMDEDLIPALYGGKNMTYSTY